MPSWIITTLFMSHMDEKHHTDVDFLEELVVLFSEGNKQKATNFSLGLVQSNLKKTKYNQHI